MQTKLTLDLHHKSSPESISISKLFDGSFFPPLKNQDQNFNIAIEHEGHNIYTEVQSMIWLPDENIIALRTRYINFFTVEMMQELVRVFHKYGWE